MSLVREKYLTIARTVVTTLTFDNAKTAFLAYTALSYMLQSQRHLRANGLGQTIHDAWIWVQKVRHVIYIPYYLHSK